MRGFQAASFTLSDKTETILKNFNISYSMPSCIVLRSKIILMATGKKQYPDCKSARHNLFNCQSMTVRTAMKLCSINCIIFTYIHSPNPEIFPNHRNLEYKKNYPLPKMPQC